MRPFRHLFYAVFSPSALPVQESQPVENAWYSPSAQFSLRSSLSLYWTMGLAETRFSSRVASATAPDAVTSRVLLPSLILPGSKDLISFLEEDQGQISLYAVVQGKISVSAHGDGFRLGGGQLSICDRRYVRGGFCLFCRSTGYCF
jgi:hypothetical protein